MALLSTIRTISEYFREIGEGFYSLLRGLMVTGKYFIAPRADIAGHYPENRDHLKMFDSFKGELTLIHDDQNQHLCDACNNCERKCPNGSIQVVSTRVQGEDGRSKRVLEKYTYHLDMCTFCGLCVQACEQHALEFRPEFEHAVFDKSKLVKTLNRPGSTCRPKTE